MRNRMGLLLIVALGGLAGCSTKVEDKWTKDRPKMYPVSGTVLLDGVPLTGALVTLRPQGQGVAAVGMTDVSGNYRVTTYDANDGAAAGPFLVSVALYQAPEPPPGYNPETSPPLPPAKLISPAKFADFEKSGLQVTVSETGKNVFDFDLTSK